MKINWHVIFFILITIYPMYVICWDGLLEEIIEQNKGRDNFCIANGFKESTSYYDGDHPIFVVDMQVECDKVWIGIWDMKERCTKIDKWGVCHETNYILNLDALEINDGEKKNGI